MINTVICKPTRACNADCSYCAAPPDGERAWDIARFKSIFDAIAPRLSKDALILWHGGEPMLLKPRFYQEAYAYARECFPYIRFGMQSNLLLYDTSRWRSVFENIFEGRVSTSFDPECRERTIKGDALLYRDRFFERLNIALDDGLRPLVIGTYSEETMPLVFDMYERSMAYGERAFSIRVNYRYPAGRLHGQKEAIAPATYGEWLVRLFDRWITDSPNFDITPLDQMFKKVIGVESGRCPWTRSCGGRFLAIEPNGDTYNCGEYADLKDPQHLFGNIQVEAIDKVMSSPAAILIRRRAGSLPGDCIQCRHFQECEGGCSRDAALFGNGVLGKFHYCASWMMVFDRIKEAIMSGEADRLISRYGLDPSQVRLRLAA